MAVVMLAGSRVVPGWVLMVGVMLALIVSAFAQWVASAPSRRQKVSRLVRSLALGASVGVAVYMLAWDCFGLWDWLCFAI
jgi:hypothetical protein